MIQRHNEVRDCLGGISSEVYGISNCKGGRSLIKCCGFKAQPGSLRSVVTTDRGIV